MKAAVLRLLVASTLVAASAGAVAGPRYYGHSHGYYHGGGYGWGGLALGLALSVPLIAYANQVDRGPDVVYVPAPAPQPPQVVYVQPQSQPQAQPAYAASRPAPVIYPRNGQTSAQLESDSRECNRWATTQQAAMTDSSVFQRAVEACMDGRGYTLR